MPLLLAGILLLALVIATLTSKSDKKLKKSLPVPRSHEEKFTPIELASLREVFRDLDKDGSGSISTKEIAHGFSSNKMEITQKELEEMVEDICGEVCDDGDSEVTLRFIAATGLVYANTFLPSPRSL